MKIKSSKNIDMKKLLIAWIVGAVILIPTRIYQLLSIVDTEGFYTKTDFTVVLMYVFLIVLVAGFFAGSFLSSKVPKCEPKFYGNKVLGCISIAGGLALFANAVICGKEFLETYNGFNSQTGVVVNETVGNYLIKSGALADLGVTVFALCSAAYFILLGLSSFVEKINVSKLKILALSPVVWAICRMLTKLTETISYIKVSDLFYEIIMLLFMMLFFMAFAQVNSKVNESGLEWKLYGYGFFASLMALMTSLPRLVVALIGKDLSPYAQTDVWDLLLGLFIIVYLISFMRIKKEEKSEAEE